MGSFLAFLPFYVCNSKTKNVELRCCKTHHVHWSIQALSENTKQKAIDIGSIDSYGALLKI